MIDKEPETLKKVYVIFENINEKWHVAGFVLTEDYAKFLIEDRNSGNHNIPKLKYKTTFIINDTNFKNKI